MAIKRVLIADDHPLYREAERAQVERTFPGAVTVLVGSSTEAVETLGADKTFDLILIDLMMPGSTDARGVERVVAAANGVPVVVVSGSLESHDIRSCIAAGAKAFVPKTIDPQVFASALNIVAAGGTYVPVEYLQGDPKAAPARSPTADLLTPREFDILRLVVEGHPNKEIARRLGIQEVTVKVNLTRIFGRLGARNRAQAAAIAVEMKLFPKPE
ncbi:MAG TPA: response regulator transcription factor [Magnetospirillaceae bacterium]|jgi:DNA-binding NarL/FixJ family response regulator